PERAFVIPLFAFARERLIPTISADLASRRLMLAGVDSSNEDADYFQRAKLSDVRVNIYPPRGTGAAAIATDRGTFWYCVDVESTPRAKLVVDLYKVVVQ